LTFNFSRVQRNFNFVFIHFHNLDKVQMDKNESTALSEQQNLRIELQSYKSLFQESYVQFQQNNNVNLVQTDLAEGK
jgi:hypothetical protein